MNVIIDFDGTVVDSSRAIIEDFKTKFNKDFEYDPTELQWDFSPYATTQEEKDYCMSCFSHIYPKADVIDEVNLKTFLEYCKTKGYRTIICSKRFPKNFDACWDFIQNHNLPFDDYIFTSTFDKSLIGNDDDIIIDDQMRCLNGKRYQKIWFGEYGYQTDMPTPDVVKLKDWGEVLDFVKSKSYKCVYKGNNMIEVTDDNNNVTTVNIKHLANGN